MKRAGVAAAAAIAIAGCGGDDLTSERTAPAAHGALLDATVHPARDGADAPFDATLPDASPPDASRPTCAREADASAADAGEPLDSGSTDAGDAGDAAACAARVLAQIDFDRDPPVVFGGANAGALAIGHAGRFLGPPKDRRGAPGGCFLASHPGAVYLGGEDAWAELGPFDLRAASGCSASLRVWIWYELEDSRAAANLAAYADGGPDANIGAADGVSLYNLDDFATESCGDDACPLLAQSVWSSFAQGATTWREAVLDLSAFAGMADVRVRLQFHSDPGQGFQGIYLGDMTIASP